MSAFTVWLHLTIKFGRYVDDPYSGCAIVIISAVCGANSIGVNLSRRAMTDPSIHIDRY
jgi:hypothetical protein